MKIFKAYIEDGEQVFKVVRASKNVKSFKERYGGNGEITMISDVTKDFFNDESVDALEQTLLQNGWGIGESSLIAMLLDEHIKGVKK